MRLRESDTGRAWPHIGQLGLRRRIYGERGWSLPALNPSLPVFLFSEVGGCDQLARSSP